MANPQHGNWQKYSARNPIQRYLIQQFLATVKTLVAEINIETVVDIGCAEGFVMHDLLEQNLAWRSAGIDIDREALRRGRELLPGFRTQQADIYHLPYAARQFDLALCLEVLEHVDHPERAAVELKRVSRQYGLFSVPHEPFFSLANLLRGKNIRRLGNDIEHVHRWGKGDFLQLLQTAGWRVQEVRLPFPWLTVLAEAL